MNITTIKKPIMAKPKEAYRLVGAGIELDTGKVYEAIPADNIHGGGYFLDGILLSREEIVIVNPYRKGTLEHRIHDLIGEDCGDREIQVIAFELWGDGEGGWSVNQGWRMATGTLEDVMEDIRGRWEVFKVNYAPKGRVSDIDADGDDLFPIYLNHECTAFLEIRLAE